MTTQTKIIPVAGRTSDSQNLMNIQNINSVTMLLLVSALEAAAPAWTDSSFFESKVRPLLVERCYPCHSAVNGKSASRLAFDTQDGWRKGGDRGPALMPGKPDKSFLIRAGCSTKQSLSGTASLAAHQRQRAATDVNITLLVSRCGWQTDICTALQTNSAGMPSETKFTSTTCTPRSYI